MRLQSVALTVLILVATGCVSAGSDQPSEGKPRLSGRIEVDGSSTLGPFLQELASRFEVEFPDVRIVVGASSTGRGFERFCAGETDLASASRPITDREAAVCAEKQIEYLEFPIVNDALTIVVSKHNTWVDCVAVDELRKVWQPGSNVDDWSQVRKGFPSERLVLFGTGAGSDTFDYFTQVINGTKGAIRSDFFATRDGNLTAQAVAGKKGAIGFVSFFHYEKNRDTLRPLQIDDGAGCATPSVASVQLGTYRPLSRTLFVYANNEAFVRREVEGLVGYGLVNQLEIATAVNYIPLTESQIDQAMTDVRSAAAKVEP